MESSSSCSICQECGKHPFKYRCPGCNVRSCSLPCVNSHKKRLGCNGKRSRTQFVPLSKFDDNILLSDYNLLEETKRIADSARRMRDDFKSFGYKLPRNLLALCRSAKKRATKVLILSRGMSKREKNRSYYSWSKQSIYWTVEWRFDSTDVVFTDHGIEENRELQGVIEKHLKPGPWNLQVDGKLKPFRKEQLDKLKFLVLKNPKGPKPLFRELDITSPLRHQLIGIMLIEFPVIHVVLPQHAHEFAIDETWVSVPRSRNCPPDEPLHDLPSPKGVYFREEEIQEDDELAQKPQVLDSSNHVSSVEDILNIVGGSIKEVAGEREGYPSSEQEVVREGGDFSLEKQGLRKDVSPVLKSEEMEDYFPSDLEAFEVNNSMDFGFDQVFEDGVSRISPGELYGDDHSFFKGVYFEDDDDREEGEIVEF
ncbi:hypothetical protein AMTRI_Chr06g171030 [Amborella trichopoda]